MNDSVIRIVLFPITAAGLCCALRVNAQDQPGNQPLAVSISWPRTGDRFSVGTVVKIKAEVTNANGPMALVRFFVQTNLIGATTTPPFNALWEVDVRGADDDSWNIKAVVSDGVGVAHESAPVKVYYHTGAPPEPVIEIMSPRDGEMFAEAERFAFSAEVLASLGDTGPIEYFVGTNSVGIFTHVTSLSADTPPSSIVVSNLAEGEYGLAVRYLGANGCFGCPLQPTRSIRVVRLGLHSPRHTLDGRPRFEVVTSFPGRPNIIETSLNLDTWTPISTNVPSTNAFTFTVPSPIGDSNLFYRVRVPPE